MVVRPPSVQPWVYVAFIPVLRSPAGSGGAGSCGFSSSFWFSTFAMGSPQRGRGWFFSIGSKVWHVSLSLLVVYSCSHCPTYRVTFCVKWVDRFPLVHTLRLSVPHSVTAGAFLVVLAAVVCLRMFLALPSVLPFPLLWFHVRLHSTCSRPRLVLGALPTFLPGDVRPSVCGVSSCPATAGTFPGCTPCGSES